MKTSIYTLQSFPILCGNNRILACIVLAMMFSVSSMAGQTPDASRKGNTKLYSHYKGLEAYGVEDAWRLGITGKGVIVAVSDSGIDFGNADLYGSQARVTTKGSPYYGWPIVIDLFSTTQWQDSGIAGNQFIDTSSTDTTGYIVTGTSKSGVYHIGIHPDQRLKEFYGEPVRVLLVDEKESGVYDTVYVDLNDNHDFRDDKACRKGDEISIWDRDGDGLPDESGGMVYFIADGVNPPPLGRLLYGNAARVPKSGELVAIHYDWASHGTMCAGTIGARGRVVKGIAPEVQFIPVMAFPDDIGMILTSLGYDGMPNSGDEANVVSRSAGFPYSQKGGDELSAFLEYLTTKVVPNTTFVFAGSNEGAGYGTVTSPSAPHIITAGAIEDLWFKGSPNRGDVAAFSARGPNVFGYVKPNVLGTGAYAPRVRPLEAGHVGATAFDMQGGGTSNGTPHVAGIVALIYQAYKERHGVFPTSEVARDILMSSADDINDESFAQGAGMINARKAVELALGKCGVLVQPALYSPEKPVLAGSTIEFQLALEKHGRQSMVAIPQRLVRTGRTTFTVPANQVNRLFAVPRDMVRGDLLRISSFVPPGPREQTLDDTARFGFWLSAYRWQDLNHAGQYGPGAATTLETAQKGEVELLANTDWGAGGTSEVRIHDPQKRIGDGLLIGLKHTEMDPGREVKADPSMMEDSDVVIVVESFTWQRWDALHVSQEKDRLQCRLQTPESTGIFEGRILLSSKGGRDKQSIPVSFSTFRKDGIRLANALDIFENDRLYARIEGSGRDGYRDDRYFALFNEGEKQVDIKVSWEDPGTDVNLALYGAGKIDTSKAWTFPAAPPIKMPILPGLVELGRTPRRIQTAHPLTRATEKSLIANAEDGVNILVIESANNGRTGYGERISVNTTPLSAQIPTKIELTGIAGQILEQQTQADAILGFGEPVQLRLGLRPSDPPYRFEARQGDRLLLRFAKALRDATLYFDTSGNGKPSEDTDEVIIHDLRADLLIPDHGELVTLPHDGTYFLTDFEGTSVLLTHRWAAKKGSVCFPVPRKVGTYVGIAEKSGQPIPGEVTLTVQPAKARRVEVTPRSSGARRRFVDVDLRVLDEFDNPAPKDLEATVSLRGNEQRVRLIAGVGHARVQAPDEDGEFSVTARTELGLDRGTLDVRAAKPVEIEDISVSQSGITTRLINTTGADLKTAVYANPRAYGLAEKESEPLTEQPFYFKGYRKGYLPLSAHTELTLKAGEERVVTLPIQASDKPELDPSKLPFLIVATTDGAKVLGYGVIGNATTKTCSDQNRQDHGSPISAIKESPVDEMLSMQADGLISAQLNDEPPLFFCPEGNFGLIPDATGRLIIRAGASSHTVQVTPRSGASNSTHTVPLEEAVRPSRVTGLQAVSEKDGVRFTWKAPEHADIDHYVVYRVGRTVRKEAETHDLQYLLKAELWNSYTVRVVAVDKNGVESKPSEPCGIVYTPLD
jgi:subtilisin family serine protease